MQEMSLHDCVGYLSILTAENLTFLLFSKYLMHQHKFIKNHYCLGASEQNWTNKNMPFVQSYSPNYFSLDDILVTQERIPCKFLANIPGMGMK